jgi:hypothetical protein
MTTIDDLAALAKDEKANQKIRDLVLRLGIFVGLEFEEGRWGKRPIRRLRRGVIAFGEDNLPVPIHGHSRANLPAPDAAGHGGTNHTHSAPACCRAPSAEHGSSAGEGTVNSHTDESNSGLEQTHQGTNVGATGLEPATSSHALRRRKRTLRFKTGIGFPLRTHTPLLAPESEHVRADIESGRPCHHAFLEPNPRKG